MFCMRVCDGSWIPSFFSSRELGVSQKELTFYRNRYNNLLWNKPPLAPLILMACRSAVLLLLFALVGCCSYCLLLLLLALCLLLYCLLPLPLAFPIAYYPRFSLIVAIPAQHPRCFFTLVASSPLLVDSMLVPLQLLFYFTTDCYAIIQWQNISRVGKISCDQWRLPLCLFCVFLCYIYCSYFQCCCACLWSCLIWFTE